MTLTSAGRNLVSQIDYKGIFCRLVNNLFIYIDCKVIIKMFKNCFRFILLISIILTTCLAAQQPNNNSNRNNRINPAVTSTARPNSNRQNRNLEPAARNGARRATTPEPIAASHHRSAKCLILQLAVADNITAIYKDLHDAGPNHNKTFNVELILGANKHIERYLAHGSSKKKAQEKASRDAYAQTTFPKPPLKPRTCLLTDKSPISLVHEWAAENSFPVEFFIVEQELGPPKTYTIQCNINHGTIVTSATGSSKKVAKAEAAEKMIEKLRTGDFGADPARKYNGTAYHAMHAVSRLNEIAIARNEREPAYRLLNETKTKEDGKEVNNFVMQVSSDNFVGVGSGTTKKAAKKEAARNLLNMMNFTVSAVDPDAE